jgi:hypothetical protein
MKLKLGKMTSTELALWFNISKKSFTNNASRYLDKLNDFARFERVWGGVEILEIYLDEYVKGYNIVDDSYFDKEIDRCIKEQDGLASISGMANKAKLEVKEYEGLADSSLRYRLSKAAARGYGPNGSHGFREREWAIKLDDYNHYRPLSDEEYRIFAEVTSEYQGKHPDKSIEKEKLEIRLREKEIDVDEYFRLVDSQELSVFPQIMWEFSARTGLKLVLATGYYKQLE